MDDRGQHARDALEQVCARGGLARARADDDRVASRWLLHGTHRGRAVTLPGITISRFANGRIAEDWTVSDNYSLLRQLGLRRGLALAARFMTGRLPRA